MAFIRPYEARDFDAMTHICCETLPPTLDASKGAHHFAPLLWTHPYTYHSPSTCLVLDSGDGTVVGYCIACPEVVALKAAWPSYLATVPQPEIHLDEDDDVGRHLAGLFHDPEALLTKGCEDLIRQGNRATLHIDLVDEWQRRGWGGKLISEVVSRLTAASDGVGGVYVGIAGENDKVVPFYERMGFRIFGEKGRETIFMDDATTEVIWTGVVIGAFISWVLTEVQESSFKAKAVEGTIDTE